MARVRGSAILFVIGMCCFVAIATAETFTVGDAGGWSFGVSTWADGKTFHAGDTLVFNYGPGRHNVALVNKQGYDACSLTPASAKVLASGSDNVKLAKGDNYFICTFPTHCDPNGMKIHINAV